MQENNIFYKVLKVRVIPMKVRETESKFKDLVISQKSTKGFLGAVFLKAGASGVFLICLKFADRLDLQNWESGNGNTQLNELMKTEMAVILSEDFYDADDFNNIVSTNGQEISLGKSEQMPKYKMAVIVWLSVFPLVTFMMPELSSLLKNYLPSVAVSAISSLFMVTLMVFVLIPLFSKLFGFWLKNNK